MHPHIRGKNNRISTSYFVGNFYIFHFSKILIEPTESLKHITLNGSYSSTKQIVISLPIPLVGPVAPVTKRFKLRKKLPAFLMLVPNPCQSSQISIILKFLSNSPECI